MFIAGAPALGGRLDANGAASHALRAPAATPPAAIGRTLHLAAVSLEPGQALGRWSSVARSVVIVP